MGNLSQMSVGEDRKMFLFMISINLFMFRNGIIPSFEAASIVCPFAITSVFGDKINSCSAILALVTFTCS